MPGSVRGWFARLGWGALAVAGPGLVLGLAARSLTAQPPWRASEQVAVMDAHLAARPFAVLTLGPSIARTDIDPDVLGAGLSQPPLGVSRIGQPLASAPMWYAILRERVYAAGHRPRLVVLVATMETLLTVRLRDTQMLPLTQHFAAPDAVISRKTLGSPWPAPVQRALAARGTLRDRLLPWFRDWPAGVWFGGDGAARVDAAGDVALGTDHTAAMARAGMVVEAGGGAADQADPLADPAESYLSDIAALVAAHGGRLAVVLPPTSTRRGAGFRVAAELERASVELAGELGVAWVDLRDWTANDGDFRDGLHLSADAARRFSAEAARELVRTNALGPGAVVVAAPPAPPATRSRTGVAPRVEANAVAEGCGATLLVPEFAAFGDDTLRLVAGALTSPLRVLEGAVPLSRGAVRDDRCAGTYSQRGGRIRVSTRTPGATVGAEVDPESAWVWPGGGLVWTWPSPWGEQGVGVVEAEVVLAGEGTALPPILRIDGRDIVFSGEGVRRSLRVELAAGAVPKELRVESPSGGAWVAVRSLRVQVGASLSELVRPGVGVRHDFVEGARFAGNPPPALAIGRWAGTPARRRVEAPWPDTTGCSPVRILEAGVPLVAAPPLGAWIAVAPADGSDPVRNGRSYSFALAEDRSCGGDDRRFPNHRVWMYPGDRFTANVALGELGAAIRSVRIQALATTSPAQGTLHVSLRVGDAVRLDERLPIAGLAVERELAGLAPFPAGTVEVEASLSADAAPMLLAWFGMEG